MHLEHLRIENFRCIERFEVDPASGRVLIVGDNAQGKTTLLEAIFYLVTGRSFRTRSDGDCLAWGRDAPALVRGRVRRSGGDSCRLAVTLAPGLKSVRVDGRALAQLGDLWGRLHAVLFTPDDLQLIKGGPAMRRRYLDVALSQIGQGFLFHLQRYGQALRQRNALLKLWSGTPAKLREHAEPWEAQLVEHGIAILRKRFEFIAALEPRAAELYARIRGEEDPARASETLGLHYANFLRLESPEAVGAEASERYRERLRASLEEDWRRGMTSAGPHRDDFTVCLDGRAARDFGSQGQVRSCVLALRLAEVIEMEARTGDAPLVLLDDLASELDPERKRRTLELLDPKWQTFLTTTRRSDFPDEPPFATTIRLPEDFAGSAEGE